MFSSSASIKIKFKQIICFLVSIAILFSISACAFKLRGYADLPEKFTTLKISPNNPYEPFQKRFIRLLQQNKVTIPPFSVQEVSTFNIVSQNLKEEITTSAPDNTPSRVRLIFTLTYDIVDASGDLIVTKQTVESVRDLSVSSNTLLSDQTEFSTLKETLWLETAHKILWQLSSK